MEKENHELFNNLEKYQQSVSTAFQQVSNSKLIELPSKIISNVS